MAGHGSNWVKTNTIGFLKALKCFDKISSKIAVSVHGAQSRLTNQNQHKTKIDELSLDRSSLGDSDFVWTRRYNGHVFVSLHIMNEFKKWSCVTEFRADKQWRLSCSQHNYYFQYTFGTATINHQLDHRALGWVSQCCVIIDRVYIVEMYQKYTEPDSPPTYKWFWGGRGSTTMNTTTAPPPHRQYPSTQLFTVPKMLLVVTT